MRCPAAGRGNAASFCMELFQSRLIEAMSLRGIRAADLARRTGLSKARISQYVNGRYIPKSEAILLMAGVLEVSPLWLMGNADADMTGGTPGDPADPAEGGTPGREPAAWPSREAVPCPANVTPMHLCRYPVVGEIACGSPILAAEDRDGGYVTAAETTADFCLTAKGDSMIGARIYDGDLVFIQQADMVANGEIAAVVVDDDEATLKRLFYYPAMEKLVLVPENAAYEPLIFVGEELNHIHVLGRAVAFQARVR